MEIVVAAIVLFVASILVNVPPPVDTAAASTVTADPVRAAGSRGRRARLRDER